LKTGAVVGQFTKAVQDEIDNFFTDGVVTTGVIIGGIFFTGDDLFRVEQLAVGTGTDFIGDGWFEIDEDATRDVFAGTGFRKKGVEGIVTTTDGFVGWHLAVRLNTVLEAVKFPAGITHLKTGLADVN
jgi:predicted TIM-barrel enzyme